MVHAVQLASLERREQLVPVTALHLGPPVKNVSSWMVHPEDWKKKTLHTHATLGLVRVIFVNVFGGLKQFVLINKKMLPQLCFLILSGTWGEWTNSTCSQTCDDGVYTKSRSCDIPGADRCLLTDGVTRGNSEQISDNQCYIEECLRKSFFLIPRLFS